MRRTHTTTLGALALVAALASGCEEDPGGDLPQRPQIFPRINPVNVCQVELGRQAQIDLMLDNRGRERLDITSIEVHHDRQCAFTPPNGDVRLYDDDETDAFAATARSRDAAFMRIEYAPRNTSVDEIRITVHSNAENFPALDIFVCGAGADVPPLRCDIRTDPACSPTGESCSDASPCALRCSASGAVCETSDDCAPPADPLVVNECRSPHYCVLADPEDPSSGTCQCRPCAIPPNEDWPDCGA
jgi:hypothetical protein